MSISAHPQTIDNLFGYGRRATDRRSSSSNSGEITGYGRRAADRVTSPAASYYAPYKRAVDVVGSMIGLVILSPLFLAVAALVAFTSPGPIIFRQRRLGLNGREFLCFKFRTMIVNAERVLMESDDLRKQFDDNFKLKNDPRLTPVGAFLRKTSLDELPQLLNVLLGSMSLIGPRPIVPVERSKYGEFADKLLSVKPGLGGFWQVYGRSDTTYGLRVRMDMKYVDTRSLQLDLKLLILTANVVLRRRGAY